MTIESQRFLLVGAGLFILGAIGFLTRRNLIMIILSSELMLHGVALTMVTFGRMHNSNEGQAFTIFTLTVAACEAGLALALVLTLYRSNHSLDIQLWSELREPDLPSPIDADELDSTVRPENPYGGIPKLTPAGRIPTEAGKPASNVSGGKSSTA
ncbi:MAG: NADH-quinone oxidoreductase subunit NuoK [Planctomyces sp.]|nr:NADH-quinone oxidoreductase subunit NuoK [Planctomyces sp.]